MRETETMFAQGPELTLYDPLGEFLGAGGGVYRYRFDDAVRLAGHACPTVAGAFVLAAVALERLYAEGLPRRGGIRITVTGAVDQGSLGPLTQVLTLITGAAADNGFKGLAGQHGRRDLLHFEPTSGDGPTRFTFTRCDTGAAVTLSYDPSVIPAGPHLGEDLQRLLSGETASDVRDRFREAWRARVEAILADKGRQTVHEHLPEKP